jgi:hypothetical protein
MEQGMLGHGGAVAVGLYVNTNEFELLWEDM